MPSLRLAGAGLHVQHPPGRRAASVSAGQDRGEAAHGEEGASGEDRHGGCRPPRNAAFLRELCQNLKRACGTGGAVSDDTIELQGDLRDRVREYLLKLEFVVKG